MLQTKGQDLFLLERTLATSSALFSLGLISKFRLAVLSLGALITGPPLSSTPLHFATSECLFASGQPTQAPLVPLEEDNSLVV